MKFKVYWCEAEGKFCSKLQKPVLYQIRASSGPWHKLCLISITITLDHLKFLRFNSVLTVHYELGDLFQGQFWGSLRCIYSTDFWRKIIIILISGNRYYLCCQQIPFPRIIIMALQLTQMKNYARLLRRWFLDWPSPSQSLFLISLTISFVLRLLKEP